MGKKTEEIMTENLESGVLFCQGVENEKVEIQPLRN